MARDVSDATPITGRDDLVAWLAAGCKPVSAHKIGTEHEKIAFYRAGHRPVPYEGAGGVGGIRQILEEMGKSLGWTPICDGLNIIGLGDDAGGGGAISIEPGGQFELSGAPLDTIHETRAEIATHFDALCPIAARLGIGFLSLGMSPKWTREETPAMPKSRYNIMARYMPKVGRLGLDMMFRTATVQANYDFSSEADMVKKMRVSIALQPVATALFANSPFTDGRLNGNLSQRSAIWRDTDNDRAGMLPFVFEDGMGFERYVDYALDVPMYFIKREGYIDVAGSSFRDLLDGRHPARPGERANLADWTNHLSTIFPEVRLKRFLEMRGADAGPIPFLTALPALFAGLLYHQASLDAAWDLVKAWTAEEREQLRADAPRLGLQAEIAGRSLRDVAKTVLALARSGLAARRRRNGLGQDETVYLDVLDEVVAGGTLAEQLVAGFKGPWAGSVDPAFYECVYDSECEERAQTPLRQSGAA